MPEMKITRGEIRALAEFCSTEPTRYAMDHVAVVKGNLAATNGKMLLLIDHAGAPEEGEAILMPVETLKAAQKMARKDLVVSMNNNETRVTVGRTTFEGQPEPPEKFPPVFSVLPKPDREALSFGFDPALLLQLAKACVAMKARKVVVEVDKNNPGAAVLVKGVSDSKRRFTALAMPMRLGEGEG